MNKIKLTDKDDSHCYWSTGNEKVVWINKTITHPKMYFFIDHTGYKRYAGKFKCDLLALMRSTSEGYGLSLL